MTNQRNRVRSRTAGFVPLAELGSRTYLNPFPGGLYGHGSNQMLVSHLRRILFASWMRSACQDGFDLRADLDGDNRVNARDLHILTAHWGIR